ncbi:MAG: hypothetical protein L6Q76_29260 [Polyangiaceae bacterium]|nr:hypothetical protein [Polyangiaceae bacterium]
MIEELEAAISHFEGEGARRFARWDAPLYRAFIEGPGASLLRAIRDSEGATLVFEAYLRTEARSPKSLMALALTTQIPTLLPKAPPGDRMALLATTWNLAEGLLGEPAWLNRAVAGALANADSLADLDKSVLRVLEAALLPRARASLAGPFLVRSVDTRAMDHAFLPGLMHFSAPALLCVHDRKRKGIHAGLLLGPKGAASLLGPCPCLGRPDKEPADLPTITLIPGGLRVGDAKIPLTFFQRGHSAAASRAGYLVASALDSQRLWVVESP